MLKSLSKLRKACTRSHRELRNMVDATQANVTAASQHGTLEVPFEPFLHACLTRHAKLVTVALDCMEKFLAFGFLKKAGLVPDGIQRRLNQKASAPSSTTGRRSGFTLGLGSGSGTGPPGAQATPTFCLTTPFSGLKSAGGEDNGNEDCYRLIDCVVEVACDCNDHPDEGVQIQVLRILLTAVTTPTCEVHEHVLLRAVRACYHVHLISKSATNRTIAKATLQQIISNVFQRMETFDRRVEEKTKATLQALEHQTQTKEQENRCHETSERDSDDNGILQTLRAKPQAAWYPSVGKMVEFPDLSRSLKATKSTDSTANFDTTPLSQPLNALAFPSVLHKDAFLLLRSLCRISMRSVADDGTRATMAGISANDANIEDPFAFQSKLLSLELVKEIVENAGPSFRRNERFLLAIRQYLCQSLLQNCTSNYTQIVAMSLQVFLVLLRNFKRHLKTELDVFITSIFLRLLQSDNASFEHKVLVLEALHAICDDPQTLGEIFLNYDCEWNTNDLFKQIVHALAKTAKGSRSQDTAAQQYAASLSNSARLKMFQQDAALALKGLECLTATAASLKKAANFVDVERLSFQHEREDLSSNNGGDEDTVAPLNYIPKVSSTMFAVEAFESKKKRQEEMATGILKFNVKPSAGIAYLVAHGHMGEGSPRDVAQFLYTSTDKLDKTMVGDYLGNGVHYQGGFCVNVLHEYVDMMDFTGMEIDVAIRHFLAGFRLPGESQKIDRMMEKFAERFFSSCPPGLFPSADTAFILAFSIIMLQTDLHNPSIAEEKKMDKAGFLRNNRGINDGKDLPEEYMGAIFDRIKTTPISLKEDDDFRSRRGGTASSATSSLFGASNAVTDRMRRDAYIKERESMVRQSEALFKRRAPASARAQQHFSLTPRVLRSSSASNLSHKPPPTRKSGGSSSLLTSGRLSSTFHEVSGLQERSHVRPMFEMLWAPLLAACSVTFESSDSAEAIQLCLDSFRHAVHLSARTGMRSERDAFVTVLAKFTALHTTNSRLMRSKNMEAIKALIAISVKEGDYLGDSWHDVLQSISQLARIQTHAQGLHERSISVSGETSHSNRQPSPGITSHLSSRNSSANSNSSFSMLGSTSDTKRGGVGLSLSSSSPSQREMSSRGSGSELDEAQSAAIEDENAARVLSEIDQLASDRVFSSSVSLSDQALQDFVVQLTVVSLSECSGVGPSGTPGGSAPRVFSLQKLVEVADMNMRTRSRMVWAATWQTLSRHFTTIGCHEDLTVGMYAIDSLRQLSMKFLERVELRDFNFQRLFLAPFEIIMANATSLETRELVLRCVENLVLARVSNIRSGWKTIWGVLRIAAETYAPGSEDRVVLLGFQVARGVLERHFDCIVDVFVDAVECMLAFAVCGGEEFERRIGERLVLTQLGVDSIGLIRNVCIDKLASGEVIEPLRVQEITALVSATSAPATAAGAVMATKQAARVGCKKDKTVTDDPTADGSESDGLLSPSVRARLRYQKHESVRSLEDISPHKGPAFASSMPSRRRADLINSFEEEQQEMSSVVYNDSTAHMRMWWPVLTALSTLAADCRLDVRLAALDALFSALENHGHKFSSGLWGHIFKGVLIPLLDKLRHLDIIVGKGALVQLKLPLPRTQASSRMPPYTAIKTTATLCLERLVECFGLFYDIVGFLPEVLFLLRKCMVAGDAEMQFSIATARAFEAMLVAYGHKFPRDVWGLIADELCNVLKCAEPTWVFFAFPLDGQRGTSLRSSEAHSNSSSTPSPSRGALTNLSLSRPPLYLSLYSNVVASLGFTFTATFSPKVLSVEEVEAQRVPSRTHLEVFLALQRIVGNVLANRREQYLLLSIGQANSLLSCLRESFLFARKVNDAVLLRQYLKRAGWRYGIMLSSSSELPSLLPQEVLGKQLYLHVLFTSLVHNVEMEEAIPTNESNEARKDMVRLVQETFHEYLAWTGASSCNVKVHVPVDAQQRIEGYTPLLVAILKEFVELDISELQRHMSWLYPLLTDLVSVLNAEVRIALSSVFGKAVRKLLPSL